MKTITLTSIFLIGVFSIQSIKSQIISTAAGNGVAGYSGDGGQATAAEFNNPNGIAFDKAGNYYISDETANRIRFVNIITGIITTVAGTGTGAFGGDGSPATAASINWPIGVILDTAGNLYIGDFANNAVRKVDKINGIITTIAGIGGVRGYNGDGGPATDAELYGPRHLAIDKNGDLYIGDAGNNVIRMINTSGIISTIAGNGTAGFSGDGGPATDAELYYPYGVALDDSDNVYIADQANNRIREIRNATGLISTIAGNGAAAHAGDGGPATMSEIYAPCAVCVANNGDVFIAGTSEQTVRKVTRATGSISTFAGNTVAGYYGDGGAATAAQLNFPAGVTLDQNGNLYVPDWNNSRVREITLAEVTTDVQAITSLNGISVYPNPANQQVFIAFNGLEGKVSVTVYNILGYQVLMQTIATKELCSINTDLLARGTYLIKVQTEDGKSYIRKVELTR